MEKSQNIRKKIITGIVIVSVLVAAFFFGGRNIQPEQVLPAESSVSDESSSDSSETAEPSGKSEKQISHQTEEIESKVSEPESSSISPESHEASELSDITSRTSSLNSEAVSMNSREASVNVPSSDVSTEIPVHENTSVSTASEEISVSQSFINNSKTESSTEIKKSQKTVKANSEKEVSQESKKEKKTENSRITEISGQETKSEAPEKETEKKETKKTEPEKQEKSVIRNYEYSCSLYISCSTAINNKALSRSKRSVLPSDGTVLKKTEYGFDKGESVFDVLKRACSENDIHFDFSLIPVTGGAYIRGINNLYEYDCGGVSGWMYKVNDEFPNVGCSDYKLSEGDSIEFLYSCDLGADIGNIYLGD